MNEMIFCSDPDLLKQTRSWPRIGQSIRGILWMQGHVSPVKNDDLPCEDNSAVQIAEIRQLQLANLPYVEYIMQDYRQSMGVATYKTAEEMEPEVLNVLPPKAELEKILEG